MAVFNELLVGRFNRALQKLTGIKGGPPVRQLGSEILPVFPLFWGVEHRYLESWNIFFSTANLAAPGAGNRSGFRIRNPAGSNVIAVMQMVTYANVVATIDGPFATFQTTNVDLNLAAGAPRSIDKRYTGNSAMIMSQQNNAAADAATIWTAQMTGNTTVNLINTDVQEFPILPGDAFSIYSGVLNQGAGISFMWRERFLEDSERT